MSNNKIQMYHPSIEKGDLQKIAAYIIKSLHQKILLHTWKAT